MNPVLLTQGLVYVFLLLLGATGQRANDLIFVNLNFNVLKMGVIRTPKDLQGLKYMKEPVKCAYSD